MNSVDDQVTTTSLTGPTVALVGGGISGLAAAWELRQRLGPRATIIVFEKNPMIGGHLRVSDVAGLPVDAGGESLLARRPEAVHLAASVGLADDIVEPAAVGAGIWSRGEFHRVPAGTVMGVPGEVATLRGLLTDDEVAAGETKRGDLPAHTGLPIQSDVAIGELVTGHYGRAVVDRLVEPLLGGVYAGQATQLSLDATVPDLGAAARRTSTLPEAVAEVQRERAEATPPGQRSPFAGIVGGIGRLPSAVAMAADADVRTGITVRGIIQTATGWQLTTGPTVAEEAIDVDGVIMAVPPPAASRLLATTAPVAAAELDDVEMASMAIVTLVLPRSAFPDGDAPSSSGFLVPPVEGRTVKAVTYSSVKWPWLGERAGDVVALRASVGRSGDVRELQRDDGELVATVRADLAEIAGISGAPIDTRVSRWGGALPQYAVGHLDRVERIRADVSGLSGLGVCGAVYDGVGVAACIASAARAVDGIVADLTTADQHAHARIDP